MGFSAYGRDPVARRDFSVFSSPCLAAPAGEKDRTTQHLTIAKAIVGPSLPQETLMAQARSFGRRGGAQTASSRVAVFTNSPAFDGDVRETEATAPEAPPPVQFVSPPPADATPTEATPAFDSVDEELREWKKTRKVQIPWRQLSLLASIFFLVASLVLTGTVGAFVDLVLYALSAISLFVWWRGRVMAK
jgi:hypothetical protein